MPSDLEAWEKKHGKIPDDVILLVFTNWARHWPDKKQYLGTDTDDTNLLHFPGMVWESLRVPGGGTPLYGLYRYVRPQRVWFFSRFGQK